MLYSQIKNLSCCLCSIAIHLIILDFVFAAIIWWWPWCCWWWWRQKLFCSILNGDVYPKNVVCNAGFRSKRGSFREARCANQRRPWHHRFLSPHSPSVSVCLSLSDCFLINGFFFSSGRYGLNGCNFHMTGCKTGNVITIELETKFFFGGACPWCILLMNSSKPGILESSRLTQIQRHTTLCFSNILHPLIYLFAWVTPV